MNNSDIVSPIEPFFPDNSIGEYGEKVFSRENRPITDEEINTYIKQYVSVKNFLNENKAPILSKIWNDAKYVNNILSPLSECGFEYTLDLSGGSVRDFVLSRHEQIKDLDFMLKIEPHRNGSVNKILENFSKKERVAVDFKFEPIDDVFTNRDEIFLKLVELCLNRTKSNSEVNLNENRNYKIYKTYSFDGITQGGVFESDKKDRLSGVVKIPTDNTNYPVDILLTDYPKPEFIDSFDFDLCKISFSLVNPFYNKKFPNNYSHLISRLVSTPGFWADYKNKKLTINIDDLANWQIDRSINDHLGRLKSKYDGFELNVTGTQPNQRKYLDTLIMTKELKASLESKDSIEVSKPKKNKI